MLNSFSADIEEYFHASNLAAFAPPSAWHHLPSRVEEATQRVLDCCAEYKVRGTFFVLGYVAARHPNLIREIVKAGHELASHGYSHRLAYEQTPKQFLRDVSRTKKLLEDLSGKPVFGYRAPSFSIKKDNAWAYDALLQAGYIYDSSIYPIWHPRYDNREESVLPGKILRQNGTIYELPLATLDLSYKRLTLRLPAAGGAYWRHLPRLYCLSVLKIINKLARRGFVCYTHPWELDERQPVFVNQSALELRRHYGNLQRFENTLKAYLRSFSFVPIVELAASHFGQEFEERVQNSGANFDSYCRIS